MANWHDYVSLVVTLAIFAGIVYLFMNAKKAVSGAVESTKDSLKSKGLDVSENGLSVKTDKRFDREQYLDATQRGFIKAFNASSAGNQPHSAALDEDASHKDSHRLKQRVGRRSQAVEK